MALAVSKAAMKLRRASRAPRILIALAIVAAIAAVAAAWPLREPAEASGHFTAEPAPDRVTELEGRRLELTSDGQVQSIAHQDEKGRAPSEFVHTPQGVVTIQRTFSDAGVLLKEDAFLDGKPVPLPAR